MLQKCLLSAQLHALVCVCVLKAVMTSVKGKLHKRLKLFDRFQSNFLVETSPRLPLCLLKLATTFTKPFPFYTKIDPSKSKVTLRERL